MSRTYSLLMVALAVLLGGSANARAADDLTKRIDALPARATEYAAIADAVVESGSADLAERLLLRVADVDVWTAAETGDLRTLKLLALGDPDRLTMVWPGYPADTPLRRAVKTNQPEAVTFLIEATGWSVPEYWNAEPDELTDSQQHRLHRFRDFARSLRYPAGGESFGTLRALHEAGLPLDAVADDEGTLLHSASGKPGSAALVAWLLERKLDPDAVNENGRTALNYAAWSGQIENSRLLLAAGADPNIRAKWGWSPLNTAIWQSHEELVALLRKQGAEVDVFAAAGLGDVDTLQRLWAKPWPKGFDGSIAKVPLAVAARCGRVEAVRWLLAEGRTPRQPPKFGPLHHAASGGSVETVKLLLDNGYDLDEMGSSMNWEDEGTPLEIAARNGHLDLVKFLIARGAEVDGTPRSLEDGDEFDDSVGPLLAAVEKGHRDVVGALLDAGARIDPTPEEVAERSKFERRSSPLQKAASKGHVEICRLLLDRGANLHGPDEWSSPLHSAAASGHLDVCRLLVERGAELKRGANPPEIVVAKIRGKDYRQGRGIGTPLHSAARGGHVDVVRYLLKSGCEVNAIGTSDLCTPLAPAVSELRERGNWAERVAIVRLLVQSGGRLVESGYARQLGYLGDPKLLALIEERGAELPLSQSAGRDGVKSLMGAAIAVGSKDVVRWLLDEGVDVELGQRARQQSYGVTLLSDCGARGAKLSALVLLDSGLAPMPRDAVKAAGAGNLDTLGALIDQGARGEVALSSAADAGREDVVKLLVERGVRLDDPDVGGAALRSAASRGRLEMVDLLLRGGADPCAEKGGSFPLKSATYGAASAKVVERLLEAGADVDQADSYGWTATRAAILREKIPLARLLVERGATLDPWTAAALGETKALAEFVENDPERFTGDKYSGGTPLQWAAREGGKASVVLLLEKLPEVYSRESEACQRALGAAASRGCIEVVRVLLAHGVSPDGDRRFPPIVSATKEKHYEVARLLLEKGADADLGKDGADRALHLAIAAKEETLVAAILATGADPSTRGRDARTPLHVAASASQVGLVGRLLDADADPNLLDEKGRTPLDVAGSGYSGGWGDDEAEHLVAHVETVRRLMRGRADVKAGTGGALYQAARVKHLELVRELLAAGVPVDSANEYGRTALMTSIERFANGGRERRADVLSIIELLLEHGASTTVEDQQGRSVQSYLDYLRLDELRQRCPRLAKP